MYRLLIVEDESWIRMGLESTIDWAALDISLVPSAANGEEALDRVRSHRPDIVLTDIRMPQMDGLELMRQLHGAWPEIMIVVISGYGDFHYAQQAIRYGAFSYVLKPIEESGLEAEIRRCVQTLNTRSSRYNALTGSLSRNSSKLREWLQGMLPDGREIVSGTEDVRVAAIHIGWEDNAQTDAALMQLLVESLSRYISSMLGIMLLASADMGEDAALLLDARDDALLMHRLHELNIAGASEQGFFVVLSVSDKISLSSDGRAAWKQLRFSAAAQKHSSALSSRSIGHTLNDFSELLGADDISSARSLAQQRIDEAASVSGYGMETGVVALAYLMSIYRRLGNENSSRFTRQFPGMIDAAFAIRSSGQMQDFLDETTRAWLDGQTAVRTIVSEAVEYISENLTDPELSLSGISTALHTNHAYLSHAFKTDMNLNITEYIMRRRIELAVSRMENSRESLQQVAQSVGYPNFQYFIRVFKKVTHTTPAQYRKNLHKQKS